MAGPRLSYWELLLLSSYIKNCYKNATYDSSLSKPSVSHSERRIAFPCAARVTGTVDMGDLGN